MTLPAHALLSLKPGERAVIIHEDDVGNCHGANQAFLELSRTGALTCGSVMVPCPWFREAVAMAAEEPSLDLGVHLTLTSEWPAYRWAPISTVSRASGLVDEEGYFWRNCKLLAEHVVIEAAEIELRAQIERALGAGIDATHLDTHMGGAFVPKLIDLYLRLGREYRLPVLLPRRLDEYFRVLKLDMADAGPHLAHVARLEQAGVALVDDFRMTPGVASADCDAAYERLVDELPEGITFLALHPCAPGDIELIVPPRAHYRTDEYRLLRTGRIAGWLAERGIRAVGYRPFRDALRAAA